MAMHSKSMMLGRERRGTRATGSCESLNDSLRRRSGEMRAMDVKRPEACGGGKVLVSGNDKETSQHSSCGPASVRETTCSAPRGLASDHAAWPKGNLQSTSDTLAALLRHFIIKEQSGLVVGLSRMVLAMGMSCSTAGHVRTRSRKQPQRENACTAA